MGGEPRKQVTGEALFNGRSFIIHLTWVKQKGEEFFILSKEDLSL